MLPDCILLTRSSLVKRRMVSSFPLSCNFHEAQARERDGISAGTLLSSAPSEEKRNYQPELTLQERSRLQNDAVSKQRWS